MKWLTLCAMLTLVAQSMKAQEHQLVEKLTVEARGDYSRDYHDGRYRQDYSGFQGRYLNVLMNGRINRQFSYSYRQRLNKASLDAGFFNATDWMYLDYQPTERWTLSAGKQVIDIGGYEYDYPPISLYFSSEYWNQTGCYAWGASIAYAPSASDLLRVQVCQSPYRELERLKDKDLYSFNLMWYGTHAFWGTKWSVNMVQWDNGHYISYIALGNEFRFSDKVSLELDYMNRATNRHTFFFRDCSVMGQLNVQPLPQLKLFAKATYDVNRTDDPADYTVLPGTEITRVGAGVEYFPLGDNRVRLHANYCYSFGTNTNPDAVMLDKHSIVDLGITWRLHVIKGKGKSEE